jgi:hypothetical protein
MADIILPESLPEEVKFANVLKDVIRQWTTLSPMPIEDIVASLAFTTGYAIGNRPRDDRVRIPTRKLREMAVERLDRGIDAAVEVNGKSSIIMPTNNNKLGVVE